MCTYVRYVSLLVCMLLVGYVYRLDGETIRPWAEDATKGPKPVVSIGRDACLEYR